MAGGNFQRGEVRAGVDPITVIGSSRQMPQQSVLQVKRRKLPRICRRRFQLRAAAAAVAVVAAAAEVRIDVEGEITMAVVAVVVVVVEVVQAAGMEACF